MHFVQSGCSAKLEDHPEYFASFTCFSHSECFGNICKIIDVHHLHNMSDVHKSVKAQNA